MYNLCLSVWQPYIIRYLDIYNVRPPRYLSWFITPITMVYGIYNYSYWGESKPTNISWGPHIVDIYQRKSLFIVMFTQLSTGGPNPISAMARFSEARNSTPRSSARWSMDSGVAVTGHQPVTRIWFAAKWIKSHGNVAWTPLLNW